MKISNIKENARAALTGKWGKGALMTLVYLVVFVMPGMVVDLLGGDETSIGSILDLVVAIIQVPIVLGFIFAFIKLKRDEEVKVFDCIKIGFTNFGKAWKITLRIALKNILPLILFILTYSIAVFGCLVYITMFAIAGAPAPTLGLFVITGILILGPSIWLFVRSLLYSLSWYIAYDNPNMTALEIVNESARMMKGNRWKIFLLDLSFIGWAILGIFTFGIGYLWLVPYMQVSTICFYEQLLGKKEDNNNENNVEAIQEI